MTLNNISISLDFFHSHYDYKQLIAIKKRILEFRLAGLKVNKNRKNNKKAQIKKKKFKTDKRN